MLSSCSRDHNFKKGNHCFCGLAICFGKQFFVKLAKMLQNVFANIQSRLCPKFPKYKHCFRTKNLSYIPDVFFTCSGTIMRRGFSSIFFPRCSCSKQRENIQQLHPLSEIFRAKLTPVELYPEAQYRCLGRWTKYHSNVSRLVRSSLHLARVRFVKSNTPSLSVALKNLGLDVFWV